MSVSVFDQTLLLRDSLTLANFIFGQITVLYVTE